MRQWNLERPDQEELETSLRLCRSEAASGRPGCTPHAVTLWRFPASSPDSLKGLHRARRTSEMRVACISSKMDVSSGPISHQPRNAQARQYLSFTAKPPPTTGLRGSAHSSSFLQTRSLCRRCHPPSGACEGPAWYGVHRQEPRCSGHVQGQERPRRATCCLIPPGPLATRGLFRRAAAPPPRPSLLPLPACTPSTPFCF